MKKIINKKLFGIIAVAILVLCLGINKVEAAPVQPNLEVANEVGYTDASTKSVATGQEFLDAYKDTAISRIVFTKDIDVSTAALTTTGFRNTYLNRSLQIDGQGYKLTAALNTGPNDYTFFRLNNINKETFHLKNMTFIAGGQNIIDDENVAVRSQGWQVIIDDVSFPKDTSVVGSAAKQREPNRVLRMRKGHLFLRNKVEMYTNAENMYIGQITVEKNADVIGEINHYDFSTWWFVDPTSNGNMNIGESAKVTLNGVGGTSYPTVYQHYKSINVHNDATLIARKPGSSLSFDTTAGITSKYINVFEGATLDAASTGTGANPIISMLGSGYSGHVYAAPKSKVFLIGRSLNDTTPLINLPNSGSSFELHQPESYDLRNNRTSGFVMRVGAGSNFKIINSDIEVWQRGQGVNLDIEPTSSWFLADVIADSNGNAITGSTPALMGVWQTSNYARITGLNANPELKLREITDADKNFTVEASILSKTAWANQVTVKVTDDKTTNEYTGKNDASGLYKYTSTDFYNAGTKVTATGYRGVVEWATLDPQATTVVKDVTPPTPAVVKPTIFANKKEVTGTSDEPEAIVKATLNNEPILDSENNQIVTTVDEAGNWTLKLPATVSLKENDVIQIFLTDSEGNVNPRVDTPFKDAIFLAGSKIKVEKTPEPINPPVKPGVDEAGTIVPETGFGIWVKPAAFSFSDIKASNNDQTIEVDDNEQRLISVVDIRGTKAGWTLEANMSTPTSTADVNEKLTGASINWHSESGVHLNPENSLTISASNEVPAPIVVSLGEDNQKILSAEQGKGEGYYGLLLNNLSIDVLANSGKKGHSYESTINWTLNDVPVV